MASSKDALNDLPKGSYTVVWNKRAIVLIATAFPVHGASRFSSLSV